MTNALVEETIRNDVLVLRIGEPRIRELEISHKIRESLIAATDRSGLTDVVIDFSRVEFMGSVGFLGLMSLRRHIADGRIIVCGLSERLRAMFVLCRLIPSDTEKSTVFESADDVEQALAAFAE